MVLVTQHIGEALQALERALEQSPAAAEDIELPKRDMPEDLYREWDGAQGVSEDFDRLRSPEGKTTIDVIGHVSTSHEDPRVRQAALDALAEGTYQALKDFMESMTSGELAKQIEKDRQQQIDADMKVLREWESSGQGGEFFRDQLATVLASEDPTQYRRFVEYGADLARKVDDRVAKMRQEREAVWAERLKALVGEGGEVGKAAQAALDGGPEGLKKFLESGYIEAEKKDAKARLDALNALRSELEKAEAASEESKKLAGQARGLKAVQEGQDKSRRGLLVAVNAVAGATNAAKTADQVRHDAGPGTAPDLGGARADLDAARKLVKGAVAAAEQDAKKRLASAKKHRDKAKVQAKVAAQQRAIAERETKNAAKHRDVARAKQRQAAQARSVAQFRRAAAVAASKRAQGQEKRAHAGAAKARQARQNAEISRDNARAAESGVRADEARAQAWGYAQSAAVPSSLSVDAAREASGLAVATRDVADVAKRVSAPFGDSVVNAGLVGLVADFAAKDAAELARQAGEAAAAEQAAKDAAGAEQAAVEAEQAADRAEEAERKRAGEELVQLVNAEPATMSEEELAEFRKQLGADARAEYDEMLAATELDLKQILINEGLGFLASCGATLRRACGRLPAFFPWGRSPRWLRRLVK